MKSAWEMSDTELLDFLESRATPGMGWVARVSSTNRGYRLHQDPEANATTNVRDAIRTAAFSAGMQGKRGPC